MHLKSYPKLVRLDTSAVLTTQRSSLFVSQQGALLRTCSSNHGSSRLPFGVISTNVRRCSNANTVSSAVVSLRLKPPPRGAALQPLGAALQPLLPAPPGGEDNLLPLRQTAAGDADASLDIWTVIKPGHVREKIAIFAPEVERTDDAGGSERSTDGVPGGVPGGGWDRKHHAAAGHSRPAKAKGSWEENCRAKRRRRSEQDQNLQQDPRTRVQDTSQKPRHPDSPQCGGGDEEAEPNVSVVEMVAFLEQRAGEQQRDSKHLLALQRTCTTIILSRAPPPEGRGESEVRGEGLEFRGEEPESVRVSDMVAKLESECLRRRTEGDLSRSNSLRRAVGRVLLATTDQSPAPHQPPSPSSMTSSSSAQSIDEALTTPPSGEARGAETMSATEAPPPLVEPIPGFLFLSPALEPLPLRHTMTIDLCHSQSEKRRRRKAARALEEAAVVPLSRRASASQDFLLMRQRLQQLLEPTPLLAALPPHLLLQVFLLLPTRSLAALKCSCRYFNAFIDDYGVRPADSLWVVDPRYRDDPCKQCKRRWRRGGSDVSLCRWHHKPYCQAMPYGPGYWMCCRGARRDAPGCNVGLHDNRWVPAFHRHQCADLQEDSP